MSLNTLNTMYYIFLVLTIVFFLIAVLLFFVFDIKRIFLIRSGKAAKRDIKKLEEESFKTGTLSKYNSARSVYGNTGSFADSGEFGSQEFARTEQMGGYAAAPSAPAQQGTVTDAPAAGQNDTTVLGQNETTVLNEEFTTVLNAGATTVLNQSMMGAAQQNRKFEIIKRDVHIHTEEVI